MEKLDIVVRPAGRSEVPATARLLARAFESDPAFVYRLPHAPSRLRRVRRYFASLLYREAAALRGTEVALVDGRIVGAALWKPPDEWRPTSGARIATLPGYAGAFQLGTIRALRTDAARAGAHPAQVHWYLHVIGAEPVLQGRGIGAALLRSRLDRCDLDGQPVYLEATRLAQLPLYRHFGFEPTKPIALPEGAPTVTGMWRPGRVFGPGSEPVQRESGRGREPAAAGPQPAVIES